MSIQSIDSHGPYVLVRPPLGPPRGGLMIRRRDADHARTVAFVESRTQWERFVAALTSGATEVDAVHAIDGQEK